VKPAKWYDLDRIVPYRDPIGLVGYLLVVGGFSLFSHAVAMMAAGVGLLCLSILMGRAMKNVKPVVKSQNKPHASM
jgi:hypothetical protein